MRKDFQDVDQPLRHFCRTEESAASLLVELVLASVGSSFSAMLRDRPKRGRRIYVSRTGVRAPEIVIKRNCPPRPSGKVLALVLFPCRSGQRLCRVVSGDFGLGGTIPSEME